MMKLIFLALHTFRTEVQGAPVGLDAPRVRLEVELRVLAGDSALDGIPRRLPDVLLQVHRSRLMPCRSPLHLTEGPPTLGACSRSDK